MKGYENRIAINETLNALKTRVENLVIASIAGVYSLEMGATFKLIQLQTRAASLLNDEGLNEDAIVANINLSVQNGIRQGLQWSKTHLQFENNEIVEMWKRFIG